MATTGSGTSGAIAAGTGSYTLAQIITMIRRRLDDTLAPYLWSNDELTEFVDSLQKQLVAEMPILIDRDTVEVCDISVVQGAGAVTFDPRIVKISQARLDGEDVDLELHDAEYMKEHYPDWDKGSVTQSTPTILVVNGIGPTKGYLYPPLAAATGTIKMLVYRLPLLDLDYTQHSAEYLEIDKYVHLIINGVLAQAYTKQGADTESLRRAEAHRVYWEGQNGQGGDKERIRRMVLRETIAVGQVPLLEGMS